MTYIDDQYHEAYLCCSACNRNVVRTYAHLSDIKLRPNGHILCDACDQLMAMMQDRVDVHNGGVIMDANGISGLRSDDITGETT